MKLALVSAAAVAAAIVAAVPASATSYEVQINPNPVTTVPTFSTATPQTVVAAAGADQIYYNFTTSLLTSVSATFQSPNPAFQFGATLPTTLGAITLYSNQTCATGVTGYATCTGGVVVPLDAGSSPTGTNTGTSVSFSNYNLAAGNYTIAVSGTAPSGGAGVNAFMTFSAAPEPATWGLMVLGFGAVGAALRTSRRKVVFA